MSRRQSVAVSPVRAPKRARREADSRATRLRLLPAFVPPQSGESLLSWILRLASSLGVSVDVLTRTVLGFKHKISGTEWWSYPTPWLIARVAAKTAVNPAQVARMTFGDWAPRFREDDARERFSGVRLQSHAPAKRRDVRIAVCTQCLEEFQSPHIPLQWALGWLSICPKHRLVMMTRCRHCKRRLRLPAFSAYSSFNPGQCASCGHVLVGPKVEAYPAAIELQARLVSGKRTNVTELPGIGRLTWPQTVTFLDLLICLFWTGTLHDERWRFVDQFLGDTPPQDGVEMSPYHSRYGGICFLSWLIGDWTQGPGAKVARLLLTRWLDGRQPQASRFAGISVHSDRTAAATLWDTPEDKFRSILVAACGGDAHSALSKSRISIHD